MIISLLYAWIKGKVDLWRFISYGFIIILAYVILFEIFPGWYVPRGSKTRINFPGKIRIKRWRYGHGGQMNRQSWHCVHEILSFSSNKAGYP